MHIHASRLTLLTLLAACAPRQPLDPAPPDPDVEVVPRPGVEQQARSPTLHAIASSEHLWTGVADVDGRLFLNFPRMRPGDDPPQSVGELVAGDVVPWPDDTWNAWQPGEDAERRFVAVQSVVAEDGALWVVDTGNPHGQGVIDRGPRLFHFDVDTAELVRAYAFPADTWTSDSYFNDVRIDPTTAYLTDSGTGGLVVLDLETGDARRVLDEHPSAHADADHLEVDGHRFDRGVHSDGIALSPDGQWLYYAPLTGHTLWRVPTAALRDPAADLGTQVERVRTVVATDGMLAAPDGDLFLGGLEDHSVYVIRDGEGYERLIQDERLSWPDSFDLDEAGDLLVTTAHLHLPPGERPAYGLWRIDL